MVSDGVKAFLNSNIIKDHPRMRSADFDFGQYHDLPESERQKIENILVSKLLAGHDARVLIALAELGTQRAVQPLQAYIERIREENGISADGLIYQATVALWHITRDSAVVIPHFIHLLHHARMGNARREASNQLAQFDTPQVRDALAQALDEKQSNVRKHIALNLARLMGVTIEETTLEAIRQGDPHAIASLRAQIHS